MIINIKAVGTTLTTSLRSYIDKKLAPLGKLITGDADSAIVHMEIGRMTKHHKKGQVYSAEISLRIGKQKLRAEAVGDEVYAAIDGVRDEIIREVKSLKSKTSAKQKAGGRLAKKLSRGRVF